MIAGERDPRRLDGLARGRMKPKQAALVEALTGRFDDHHAELTRMLLDQIDALAIQIGAAMAAARTKDATYLGARYRRLAPRLGKKKAIVAVEHSILTAIWHMLTDDIGYHDLGGDYFARLDPERAVRRIVQQANALGFTVRFDHIQAA
jgi:hypothetical protein